MGFLLEVTKKHTAFGAEMEYVSNGEIHLGDALTMVVFMFSPESRWDTCVTELSEKYIAIYFPRYIGPDNRYGPFMRESIPGYSGGFGYRFTAPTAPTSFNRFREMVTAYITAYPELAAHGVRELAGLA